MVNKIYTAGSNAYLDTLFTGLVPCKVTQVLEPGHGKHATGGKIELEITGDIAAYVKGERMTAQACEVIPKGQIRTRGYRSSVNVNYTWL